MIEVGVVLISIAGGALVIAPGHMQAGGWLAAGALGIMFILAGAISGQGV